MPSSHLYVAVTPLAACIGQLKDMLPAAYAFIVTVVVQQSASFVLQSLVKMRVNFDSVCHLTGVG